jgi:MraZ protein
MTNFLGEYEVALDAKGRFLLPSAFRKQLPDGAADKFVVNRGFEKCLSVYTVPAWEKLAEMINKLNDFNPKARDFKRLFLNGATMIEADSADRLLVPKSSLEYAGITREKDMVFTAQGNKMELWDKDTYYNYMRERAHSYSDLAAEVAGGGFMNPFETI